MSHLSSGARLGFGALALIAAGACSASQPPPSSTPEPASSGPTAPAVPAGDAGAALEAPAAEAQPAAQTLFVREQRADCHGEAPMKCLQVRETEAEEWRNLYAPIEGFDYEEAHAYELRVAITNVPSPPADGSSLRYRLLEVVSKKKVTPTASQ